VAVGLPDRLPEDSEARLVDFAEFLATAIANSEARDGLRRLFDEQAALRRVATLVAGVRRRPHSSRQTAERIGRFTELVATAVSNATMRAEVAASRARVTATADETRRRIERDLHDGAQQQLVKLALELRSAEPRGPAGLEDSRKEVGGFADRLPSVVEELREMSRGIHPATLTEGGLSPAVEALALRSGGSGLIGLSLPGSGTRLDVEIPLLPDPSVASNPEQLSSA
jgi:signal transduction histidine kinase